MHHSDDELRNVDPKFLGKVNDLYNELAAGKKLGATGRFPEGKWQPEDEGEIRFMIGRKGGKVFLDFGKPVQWVGMNGNQAIDVGHALIKHGRKANKPK